MTSQAAIGIDLGGTNLKGAAVDADGGLLAQHAIPTDLPGGPEAVVAGMVDLADGLLNRLSVSRQALVGLGVGSPGPLSIREGRIIDAANLPGWKDVPLRELLRSKLGAPVVLENDGNAAAYGEFWAGAGRGGADLVMLTLGTGVGAGVIIDGAVLHGHFENAAELGHTVVAVDGLPCACGQRGCLEQYCSAAGMARRVCSAIDDGEPCALSEVAGSGRTIDAAQVAQAARSGDRLCSRLWDDACRHLAVACVNIQHTFNPACVVLGGGMAEAGSFLLDGVTAHFAKQRWHLHEDFPTIKLAELGYDAGVIGAAGLAWRAMR